VIRLSSALEAYGLAGIEKEPGVEVVVGDFTAKRLGLSAEEYRDLAKRVGVIYHCGAEVDLLAQYADLASANVGGTEELLRFAVAGCPKAFHHVSTAGALSRKSGRAFRVADLLAEGDHLPRSGYGQSKWVAEQLVRQARRRGVRASIYRPGRIVADSATGAWNTRDLVARLLIGSLRLGVAPALALTEWVVPVDLAASALVQLSMEYRGTLESVMLASREEVRFNDLVLAVQACGFSIELVDVQKWLRAVRGTIGAVADPLLHPLLSIVEALATGTRAVGPTGQSDAWEDGLTLAGLSSPRLSELVGGWLSAWSRDGLIPDRSS
jgi:thioester reductase-like protein